MKVSITLPSIYPEALARSLKNIRDTTRADYEVVVISPFEVQEPNVKWLREEEARGCAYAHDIASKAAKGDFLVAWADDHVFVDGWDTQAIPRFIEREKLFQNGDVRKPFAMGLRHVVPGHVGTEFGIYYPYFPMMRQSMVDDIGWIGPEYRSGFGDSDLGMRIWAMGGRCEFSPLGLIVATADDQRKAGVLFTDADMVLFLERWAPTFGAGWPTDHIRAFNRDLVPEEWPTLVSDWTIYHNNPNLVDTIGVLLP